MTHRPDELDDPLRQPGHPGFAFSPPPPEFAEIIEAERLREQGYAVFDSEKLPKFSQEHEPPPHHNCRCEILEDPRLAELRRLRRKLEAVRLISIVCVITGVLILVSWALTHLFT
jgi:hypothetical protein